MQVSKSGAKNAKTQLAMMEQLESRQMLTVDISNGNLIIQGTNGDDVITLTVDSDDPNTLVITENDSSTNFEDVSTFFNIRQLSLDVHIIEVFGLDGNDDLEVNEEGGPIRISTTFDGGAGDDTIVGSAGNDWIIGGDGNDVLSGGGGSDFITGGNDDDQIFGNAGRDYLNGDAGDDTISGGNGNDEIRGGVGDDSIDGGGNNDFIDAGAGNDTVFMMIWTAATITTPSMDPSATTRLQAVRGMIGSLEALETTTSTAAMAPIISMVGLETT